MGNDLSVLLASLQQKISILAAQRDDALQRLEDALKNNDKLREQLENSQRLLQQRNMDAEFLSVSHKLADNPQALADARATIRKMILRVEKAIRLLEEDTAL